MSKPTYRIIGWDENFENNRTREMQVMRWTPIPNSFDGDRISELIHLGGAESYGAWCALLGIAGRCGVRGTLLRSTGKPHDAESMSIITGIAASAFEKMFTIAIGVGLIDTCNIPQEPAEKCANPAGVAHPTAMEGNGMERKGRERKIKTGQADSDEKPPREPDPVWDAVAATWFGGNVARPDAKRCGKIVSDLKAHGATATSIPKVLSAYKRKWPNAAATPEAIVKHWAEFTVKDEKPKVSRHEVVRDHIQSLCVRKAQGEDVTAEVEKVRERLTREDMLHDDIRNPWVSLTHGLPAKAPTP